MKRLIFATLLVAGTLITTTGNAQVYMRARVGFGFAPHRVYVAPRIVYRAPYPVPYYNDPVIVTAPAYGYGHNDPYYYHERRWRHRRYW